MLHIVISFSFPFELVIRIFRILHCETDFSNCGEIVFVVDVYVDPVCVSVYVLPSLYPETVKDKTYQLRRRFTGTE